MNTSNLKDTITNIVAYILVALGALNTFLQANAGQPINWQQLVLFVTGAVISYLIGKQPNGKTKTPDQVASQNAPTGNVIKMIALLIGLTFASTLAQAQSPFKGFFKPLNEVKQPKTTKSYSGDITITPASQWLFRPTAQVTGLKLQYVGGTEGFTESAFTAAGIGISYQKVSVVNGLNYSNLSFNALLNFNYNIQSTAPVKLGGFADVAVFNNLIGLGIGWDAGEKYPYLGLNVSWQF
jgi:hypothetical protein